MVNATNTAKRPNPMLKIFVVVGIAIAIFVVFTVFSVHESIKGKEKLADIKNLYFPVLERMDANTVRLDKMEEQFIQVALMGEPDLIEDAERIQRNADKVFDEIADLYPKRKDEIQKIRESFDNYNAIASETTRLILKKRNIGVEEESANMNKVLQALKSDLKAFRQSSYDNFVSTLESAQQGAKLSMMLGLLIGGMNLCFMGILVFFIRNNIKMMAIIETQNATLELRVLERTAELNRKKNDIEAMLQNMDLGVCTIVEDNKIHSEYSQFMCTIFEKEEFARENILDAIFSKSTLGVDTKDQISTALSSIIGEDSMMFDFNSHLLVNEIILHSEDGHTDKIVQLNWNPIINENDVVEKVLFISQDVTQLRKLELESRKQKEELDIIASIIQIAPEKFNDFIESATKFVAENYELIKNSNGFDKNTVAALFRNMHTIKGNSRTYNFGIITNAAHSAEHYYDQLRNNPEEVEYDPALMLKDLAEVELAIDNYRNVNENKLGRKSDSSSIQKGVFVPDEKIDELKQTVESISSSVDASQLSWFNNWITKLGKVSLDSILNDAKKDVAGVAEMLEKPVPHVVYEGNRIMLDNQFTKAFKSSLTHILRNSLDHGIEEPAERTKVGKSPEGTITFTCFKHDAGFELHIQDDGKGLALDRIREKGISTGVISESESLSKEETANLIFVSGLSSAAVITETSGRGVGMDAVSQFLHEHNSSVKIVLDEAASDGSYTPFKLVIELPNNTIEA